MRERETETQPPSSAHDVFVFSLFGLCLEFSRECRWSLMCGLKSNIIIVQLVPTLFSREQLHRFSSPVVSKRVLIDQNYHKYFKLQVSLHRNQNKIKTKYIQ
jgi:hypothetical protein